jgi:hypothetical protein
VTATGGERCIHGDSSLGLAKRQSRKGLRLGCAWPMRREPRRPMVLECREPESGGDPVIRALQAIVTTLAFTGWGGGDMKECN